MNTNGNYYVNRLRRRESFKRLINIGLSAICLFLEIALFAYMWQFHFQFQLVDPLQKIWYRGFLLENGIYSVILIFFSVTYGGMRLGYMKNTEIIFSQVFATLMADVLIYAELCMMARSVFPPDMFLLMVVLQIVAVIIYANIANKIYRTADRNTILKFCYSQSIRVYVMPKISDVILVGSEELHVFDTPILLTREYSLSMEQRFIKRSIDVVCSLILLVITSPLMLLTALAIKLYDGGPVLYKQVRCTIGQREFYIMKFRSMRTDAEKDGVARLAQKNDDRITPIGKVIRKCRLDELPQLINILRGDMSFIGPRPERPEIIAQYTEVMPEFTFRMKVKAGLAGFAQVYGKYNTSPYDKLKLDLTYIENYSVWLDLKLMLLTLKVLFWPDSTEGVESEQVTAFKAEYDGRAEKDDN